MAFLVKQPVVAAWCGCPSRSWRCSWRFHDAPLLY